MDAYLPVRFICYECGDLIKGQPRGMVVGLRPKDRRFLCADCVHKAILPPREQLTRVRKMGKKKK